THRVEPRDAPTGCFTATLPHLPTIGETGHTPFETSGNRASGSFRSHHDLTAEAVRASSQVEYRRVGGPGIDRGEGSGRGHRLKRRSRIVRCHGGPIDGRREVNRRPVLVSTRGDEQRRQQERSWWTCPSAAHPGHPAPAWG